LVFSEVADEVEKDLGEKLKLREYSPKTYTDYCYRLNSVVRFWVKALRFMLGSTQLEEGGETAVQTSRRPPKRPA
jgi:hypothetical protein